MAKPTILIAKITRSSSKPPANSHVFFCFSCVSSVSFWCETFLHKSYNKIGLHEFGCFSSNNYPIGFYKIDVPFSASHPVLKCID